MRIGTGNGRVPLDSEIPLGPGCGPPAGGDVAITAALLLKGCMHLGASALLWWHSCTRNLSCSREFCYKHAS